MDFEVVLEPDTSQPYALEALVHRAIRFAPSEPLGAPVAGAALGSRPGTFVVKRADAVDDALFKLNRPATQREYRAVTKTLRLLEESGPSHPGLHTHRYDGLDAVGVDVWQSNVQTAIQDAWRMWWYYGPGEGVITVVAVGPHPKRSLTSLP